MMFEVNDRLRALPVGNITLSLRGEKARAPKHIQEFIQLLPIVEEYLLFSAPYSKGFNPDMVEEFRMNTLKITALSVITGDFEVANDVLIDRTMRCSEMADVPLLNLTYIPDDYSIRWTLDHAAVKNLYDTSPNILPPGSSHEAHIFRKGEGAHMFEYLCYSARGEDGVLRPVYLYCLTLGFCVWWMTERIHLSMDELPFANTKGDGLLEMGCERLTVDVDWVRPFPHKED